MGQNYNDKNNKIEYDELTKARISKTRNVVISSCSKGGYTIAQQLEATENNNTISVFLKGALQVEDTHGLYNLRDALNLAISMIEEEDKNN